MKKSELHPTLMPLAVGYTRVSTDDQAKQGLSLDAQAAEISEYCQRQGLRLVRLYREEGKSASKELSKRTAFLRMMGDIAAGGFAVVVVYHIDRFSRNPAEYYPLIERLATQSVNLVALNDPEYDATDPGHEMKRGIDITVALYQARLSRAKMIDVVRRKLESGKRNVGQRVPYGLAWNKDETALVHDPKMIRIWGLIKGLRGRAWGYGRIADALNGHADVDPAILKRHGVILPVPNRWGMKVWREGALSSMFRDPCRYQGRMEVTFPNRRGELTKYAIEFPPLMSKAEFDRFAALARKNLSRTPRNVGKGSLLSSLCKCGICKATLQVTGSRASGYYGCANRLRPPKGESRCRLPLLPKAKLERDVMMKIGEFLLDDDEFERALALARPSKGGVSEAELDRQEQSLAKEARDDQALLDSLVRSIAREVINEIDAKTERERIRANQDRIAQRRADLDTLRAGMVHTAERSKQVAGYRAWVARRLKRAEDLLGLPMEEQRDLLRSLLPPGPESHIRVFVPKPMTPEQVQHRVFCNPPRRLCYEEYLRLLPKWALEIVGLLPVEQAELEMAVLGGGLAVPCICNPLQQG